MAKIDEKNPLVFQDVQTVRDQVDVKIETVLRLREMLDSELVRLRKLQNATDVVARAYSRFGLEFVGRGNKCLTVAFDSDSLFSLAELDDYFLVRDYFDGERPVPTMLHFSL